MNFIEERIAGFNILPDDRKTSLALFRKVWRGILIVAGGYTHESALGAVESGHADLIAHGLDFISNADLVKQVAQDAPFHSLHP